MAYKILILLVAHFSWTMEEGDVCESPIASPLIKNYTPDRQCFQTVDKSRFVEEDKVKAFQDWCFNLAKVAQFKLAKFPMDSVVAEALFKEDSEEICYFMTTFNDVNVLNQPRKYFNERVLQKNGVSFLNFVISFQSVWRDLIDEFERQNIQKAAINNKCDYFFKNCSQELRGYFSTFQKLSTVFLHAYNCYFEKNYASIDTMPEIKNDGGTYIGFFSDDNGYIPIALGAWGYLYIQPQIYGHGQYIKDVGYRGFLVAADGTVIRQKGLHIETGGDDKAVLKLNHFEGADSPYAYFCKQVDILLTLPSMLQPGCVYQAVSSQQLNYLSQFVDNIRLRENVDNINYFEPMANSDRDNDVLFSNYVYLEMLQRKLVANGNDDALVAAANWTLHQEERLAQETTEGIIQSLNELQAAVKEKICANYEAEIRAEQERVMKRHHAEGRQKSAGKRRGRSFAKNKTKKGIDVDQESAQKKAEKIKRDAQQYFHDHLQTSRVSYKKLCKLTNKMIKTVFREQKEAFKITTVGSHRNIHIEGSGGLTLLRKHGRHCKDHSYSPQYANNYMTKLIQLGMAALDVKSLT